ncbi:DUF883 family protein [Oceanibacterium hippocampi]|uniref:DUF883 domain-containing protein n=1 Tax=Oceanibacterium hippocampi TaxID=745714 RepID=A0A1Y5TVD3_9PROT|nr:DUF883 family protein [Oceanibacterium hippocampi]SLN73731.1 hypothetical protein OCH7691_03649 [Oceanibacterium hippocampi]
MADAAARKDTEELREQMEALRADVSALTESLVRVTGNRAHDGAEAVRNAAHEGADAVRNAARAGQARAEDAAATAQDYVRERPLASVLVALAVGFTIGKLLERR